ncbi:MAG: S24/S26 family peptidase [Halobacteriovoraceae bacterium]|jgi:signal peptidase I|nr:S24/S26 family peptidase [Halobacteriovoraceae bacterium]MBT5094015.1 S24/S26 family peptidase [Halobacteriovoraceae bacterium]
MGLKEIEIPYSGPSMSPLFNEGDVLFVRELGLYRPCLGDLIVFRDNEEWVAHRVIKMQPSLVTKGDRSLYEELPDRANLFGLVTGFRSNGNLYKWGEAGQKFKIMLAFFSRFALKPWGKVIRYFALSIIFVLTTISKRMSF